MRCGMATGVVCGGKRFGVRLLADVARGVVLREMWCGGGSGVWWREWPRLARSLLIRSALVVLSLVWLAKICF